MCSFPPLWVRVSDWYEQLCTLQDLRGVDRVSLASVEQFFWQVLHERAFELAAGPLPITTAGLLGQGLGELTDRATRACWGGCHDCMAALS